MCIRDSDDRKLLESLGENINKRVIENYSHISMGNRQCEIYEEILNGGSNEGN